MANHKSAAKRARQATRKNATNGRRKSSVRTFEKTLVKALESKNLGELSTLLKNYASSMMKAAQKGVFKKETASRKISRLATRVSAALSQSK